MDIGYRIDVTGLVSGRAIEQALVPGMTRGVDAILREADLNLSGRLVRSRTGSLRSSLFAVVEDGGAIGVTGRVGSTDFRGLLFEQGTAAHEITGSPLAFFDGERMVFRPRVQHPGIRPRRWLQSAYDVAAPELKAAIEQELQAAIDGARR